MKRKPTVRVRWRLDRRPKWSINNGYAMFGHERLIVMVMYGYYRTVT
jgi:hypothetical protein